MRMARVNITLPDDLVNRAKEAKLNISASAAKGLTAELERLDKIRELEKYLAELEAELGPPSAEELAEGEAWAERVFGPVAEQADRSA